MKNEMPLNVLMETAKAEYIDSINKITEKYKLNPYVIWLIFFEIYMQMEKNKVSELNSDFMKQEKIKNDEE